MKEDTIDVAIVGAGPAGLVCAKTLLERANCRIIVFEEATAMGGLWNRQGGPTGKGNQTRIRPPVPCRIHDNEGRFVCEVPSSSQPVYENLRANFPKDMTSFLGYPFPPEEEWFPGASVVNSYYQSYGKHFAVDKMVRFETRVEECKKDTEKDLWVIRTVHVRTGERAEFLSKRLLVCNGHYRKPFSPYIPGMENFGGKLIHSSAFQSADQFKNQSVLIVGGGISGSDIASNLLKRGLCTRVILSARQWKMYQSIFLPKLKKRGLVVRPGVDHIDKEGRVHFAARPDNDKKTYSTVGSEEGSEKPTVILFATGYRYYFPFLNIESPGIPKIVRNDGFRMERLYKRILSIDDTSLAFVGITNQNLSPALVMEYQARWYTQMVMIENCDSITKGQMVAEVESRSNDRTQDALLLQFPAYCTSLARDIQMKTYWTQIVCDRLPLMIRTYWARCPGNSRFIWKMGAIAVPVLGAVAFAPWLVSLFSSR